MQKYHICYLHWYCNNLQNSNVCVYAHSNKCNVTYVAKKYNTFSKIRKGFQILDFSYVYFLKPYQKCIYRIIILISVPNAEKIY